MELNDYEKSLVNGDYGSDVRRLMEIMLKIGEVKQATDLIDVKQVMLATTQILHLSGEAGIDLLVRLADTGIKFKTLTITDPVSMDVEGWRRLGLPEDWAKTQLRSVEALKKLGAVLTLTCTPYLCGAIPRIGDHVAYVETSAVVFANSYFGARTNREVDVAAIATGLCGRTPNYGYHLANNRRGEVLVNLKTALKTSSDYDALGNYLGKIVKTRIPVFKNMDRNVSSQSLMQLGAALATTGSVPLFHAVDITPEIMLDPYKYGKENISEEIDIGHEAIETAYQEMNTTTETKVDFVALGCPHCTVEKLKYIASFLENKKVNSDTEVWICTSDAMKKLATRTGDVDRIEKTGAKVVVDCCMVTVPVKSLGYKTMATDSAKAQFYVSGADLGVRFGTTDQCLESAVTGYWEQ